MHSKLTATRSATYFRSSQDYHPSHIMNQTKRSILRWIHIVFGIPIVGYIYSPFEEIPNYAPRCSVFRPSCHCPFGILDVERPCPLTTFFEKIGLTRHSNKKETSMKGAGTKKELSPKEREELLKALKARFEKNMNRHKGLEWAKVQARLEANAEKLWSLNEMEKTGGEPDVVGHDKKTGEYIFFDCSPESPKGRTSVCYDREGLESRKEHKPKNTAMDMAAAMGIELLTEEQYQELQKLGDFDTKTSSWVKTPADMRKLGGALFGDRRYGRVFVYHNGAQSYYSGRAFRGSLRV